MTKPADWIQAAVVARTAQLGLTGVELARRSGVSQPHVADYLAGRSTMGSWKLQHVLTALGLALRPVRR
jgi:predicted transcriptional regulator